MVINSGGAEGTDKYFEKKAEQYNFKCNAFSYKTYYHRSPNKVEITESDFKEGVKKVLEANSKYLKRPVNHNSSFINLLARNWPQVKYSKSIVAIGYIIEPKGLGRPNNKGIRYMSKSNYETVDGGTGYAVAMGINEKKDVFVFNLADNCWYDWSYNVNRFLKMEEIPDIRNYDSIAGVGTRNINSFGEQAIDELFVYNFE